MCRPKSRKTIHKSHKQNYLTCVSFPDPGGPKTCGSGSGSTTFSYSRYWPIKFCSDSARSPGNPQRRSWLRPAASSRTSTSCPSESSSRWPPTERARERSSSSVILFTHPLFLTYLLFSESQGLFSYVKEDEEIKVARCPWLIFWRTSRPETRTVLQKSTLRHITGRGL